jgi:hypothetical protein
MSYNAEDGPTMKNYLVPNASNSDAEKYVEICGSYYHTVVQVTD